MNIFKKRLKDTLWEDRIKLESHLRKTSNEYFIKYIEDYEKQLSELCGGKVYFKLYNGEIEEKIGINLNGQKDLKKNFSLEAEIISAGNLKLRLYFNNAAIIHVNLQSLSHCCSTLFCHNIYTEFYSLQKIKFEKYEELMNIFFELLLVIGSYRMYTKLLIVGIKDYKQYSFMKDKTIDSWVNKRTNNTLELMNFDIPDWDEHYYTAKEKEENTKLELA